MRKVICYHGNCRDGYGAAWAAWRILRDKAIYIPVLYGDDPPAELAGADVVIADFSYPRKVLLDLKKRCETLKVLDHHKTAEADLAGLDFCTFDMDKSGAMLTWEWYHQEPAPFLIQYIQDRDLWRFELPDSKEITAWLDSYPMDFEGWATLSDLLEQSFDQIAAEGKAILRSHRQQVETMCQQAVMLQVGGHLVPVVNTTILFSEVGERLCELHPDANFAAYYLDRKDGKRQWGLRSRGDFDVSEVAKQLGGGGHPAAAGFTTKSRLQGPRHAKYE